MKSNPDIKAFARTLRANNRRLLKYRILVTLIDVSLYFFGLKKNHWLLNLFLKIGSKSKGLDEMSVIDRTVTIFNQIKIKDSMKGKCLSQSLAMQFILRRKSIDTTLIIGGFIKNGSLFAHAWLEKEGEVLNDHPSVTSRYKVLLDGNGSSKF